MFQVFFCLVSKSILNEYLHSSRGDVSSFARNNFIFCGVFTFVFRVSKSGGVFGLGVSGKSSRFGNIIKIIEIYLLYG